MSDNLQDRSVRERSWTKYEVGAFEAVSGSHVGHSTDFIPVQLGDAGETAFAGFQGYGGDDEDSERIGHDVREEKELIADIEQVAYEKGFAQGEKDGYELGEQRGIKVLENIEGLLVRMEGLKRDILRQYEKEILETIFTIAEKITHVHIGLNDSVVTETILNAVQYAAEKHTITLRINPVDFNFVEKLRPELFEAHRELKSITVTADGSISRGGCLLETPGGDVDATIETQLEKISECIANTFSGKE